MDDLTRQVRAWAEAAAATALDPVDTAEVEARSAEPRLQPASAGTGPGHRRRRRVLLAIGAAAAVALVAVGLAVAVRSDRDPTEQARVTAIDPDALGWTDLGDAPLSPRVEAGLHWTGHEVLVVGGEEHPPCPPTASCIDGEPERSDGAAYDPATRRWRTIAPLPVEVAHQQGVVVDGDLYLLGATWVPFPSDEEGRSFFLRYDPEADRWDELPPPPAPAWRQLVADGDRLVAYLHSHEQGHRDQPDLVWDPSAAAWSELPPDPLGPASSRSMVAVDGDLYLFGNVLLEGDEIDASSPIRGAVLHDGRWRTLPPSPSDGAGGVVATEGVIVSPYGEFPDSEGEPLERPWRWLYDTRAAAWQDSPPLPDEGAYGHLPLVAGRGQVVAGDVVFDVATRTWRPIDLPPDLERAGLSATWAGDRLVVFGGSAGYLPDDPLHADLWQWRPSPAGPAPTSTSTTTVPTTTTTSPATTTTGA